jgi:Cu+-exporting ATPase
MGLATPAAIMAGVNAAARRGILIRDGEALEKSGRITAVLFDKTGTLTEGKLTVAAVNCTAAGRVAARGTAQVAARHPAPSPSGSGLGSLPLGDAGEGDSLRALTELAAALAAPSSHPLSRAVAAHFGATPSVALAGWHEVRGAGIEAVADGVIHRLGSLRWLTESGVAGAEHSFTREWTSRGATVLGLARGPELLALFALRDQLKPHAAEVVAGLQRQRKAVFLVTGDNAATAAAIAAQAGVPLENVFAETRPEQKADIVQLLQARGRRVAFVGDGINDAPALTQADLGIAVTRASDVAREAADLILLQSDIQAIPEALGLAQATLRTIRQNLFWAFFYNAAAVPLAALGLLSPVLCAVAMGLSDVVVIGNALRLRGWRSTG